MFADDYATFRRVYEVPILKSRAPDCTDKELKLGEAQSAQVRRTIVFRSAAKGHQKLSLIAKSFVLRREASILKNYLPPKRNLFLSPRFRYLTS
jgi:DNA repair and recombination protein RAD54B